MTDEPQNQSHHMLSFEGVGLVLADPVLKNYPERVAIGHVEEREG